MVDGIRVCITSPSYSININSELNGYFPSAKVPRLGDPLSPFLFLMVMEALVSCFREKCQNKDF